MRRTFIVTASLVVLTAATSAVSACSEATNGVVPDAATLPGAGDAALSEGDAALAATSDASTEPPLTAGDASVLLNEIAASDEWIELVASGSSSVDISGFRVADRNKDGGPKLEEALTFPPGTVLSPKAYVIVQGGGLDGGGKACPDGGQRYCFNAEFGISNKNGESVYLIDKAGAVVGTVDYPPQAAASGETWGRLPSGVPSAAFGKALPTPGAANQPAPVK